MKKSTMRVLGGCAAVLATVAGAVHCTSSSSSNGNAPGPGCEVAPLQCPQGTTCWAKDCVCPTGQACDLSNCTPRMACLPSVPGKNPHDRCSNVVNQPSCSDKQACVEFVANGGGCLSYCDDSKPNRGCPSIDADIETCIEVKVGKTDASPTIHVCAIIDDAGDGGGLGVEPDASRPVDAASELPN